MEDDTMTTDDVLYSGNTRLKVVEVNEARTAVRIRFLEIEGVEATATAGLPVSEWFEIIDLDRQGWRVWHPYRGGTPAAIWEERPCLDV